MFPNPRRNKIEMMYSTLSPNTLTPSEQGLGMSPEAADVVNFARTRMNREAMNQVAGADAQDQADWVNSGGLAPSGRVYRSPTGAPTPETEAIIAAGRQRIDPAGPDMSHIMRAAANGYGQRRPVDTTPVVPQAQGEYDVVGSPAWIRANNSMLNDPTVSPQLRGKAAENIDNAKSGKLKYGSVQEGPMFAESNKAPFDAEAYAASQKAKASPYALAQKARYDAAQAKQPEIRDNLTRQAMADAVMRRGRLSGHGIDPLTARLFVDSNSGSTGGGDGGRKFSGGMNPAYQALYPNAAKTAIAADAAAADSENRNVLERTKAEDNRRIMQAQITAKLVSDRMAQLDQLYATAASDEERMRIAAQKRDLANRGNSAIAQASGLDQGILDEFRAAGESGWRPSSVDKAGAGISVSMTNDSGPDMSTPEGRNVAAQTRMPTTGEIARAYPFADGKFAPGAEQAVPPPPGETTTDRAVQFAGGQAAAQRVMEPIMADAKALDPGPNTPDRNQELMRRLRAKYPSVPEDQLQFAIGRSVYQSPEATQKQWGQIATPEYDWGAMPQFTW